MPDSWIRNKCVGNMWLRDWGNVTSRCVCGNLTLVVSLDLQDLMVKM